nr:hypothetical protein [Tanacetum cinerariifolium]
KPRRKVTEVPQLSDHTSVGDEAVNEEMDDSLERAATTTTSLDAKYDRGNIFKTQSNTTPNKPVSQGTSLGDGPRCQKTMGVIVAQTRSERVSKISNDTLLAGVNTSQNGEDNLKLNELTELCTKLQQRVLDLETTKTTQALEIKSLKRRVKKLKRRKRSRTHGLKRLYKVRLSARVESSKDEDLAGEEVFVAQQDEKVVEKKKRRKFFTAKRAEEKRNKPPTQAQQRKIMCTYLKNMEGKKLTNFKNKSFDSIQKKFDRAFKRVNTFVDYRTELVEESSKKAKADVIEGSFKRAGSELKQENAKKQKIDDDKDTAELQYHMLKDFERENVETLWKIVKAKYGSTRPEGDYERVLWEESTTTTTTAIPKPRSQDNGKAKMIKEPVKLKKKDQIQLDKEVALKLQAEFEKEERLAKKRRKFFTAKRAEEKRNKPPTQAQQRKIMCTYLKNMEGKKLTNFKNKSFDSIQKKFDRAFKRVNTFVDYRTELVEESSKKAKADVIEGSFKRAGSELKQENAKKQKIDDDKDTAELQ